MFLRIDHVGIACHDLEESIAFYESAFGLTVVSREVNEEQGVREAMLHVADGEAGASYIQLLEPLGPDTPVGKFIAKRGEGVHHVGYGVADVTQALRGDRGQGHPAHRQAPAARVHGRLDCVSPSQGRRGRSDGARRGAAAARHMI